MRAADSVCGTADHSCLETGGPGCNDESCCELVASLLPSCVDVAWDEGCVGVAFLLCGGCPAPSCEGALLENEPFGEETNGGCAATTYASDCCQAHADGGCDDAACEALVCDVEPTCCNVEWDIACVFAAWQQCQGLCSPIPGPSLDVACGDVVCGTIWADGPFLDGDSFALQVSDSLTAITVVVTSEIALDLVLLQGTICGPPTQEAIVTSDGCTHTLTACLPTGNYRIQIAPSSPILSRPEYAYRIAFTCEVSGCAPNGCGDPTSGSCFDAGAGRHCNDLACCDLVCALDATCCEFQWDVRCAALAWCFCAADAAPPNDACADAVPIGEGTFPVTTCGATSDGGTIASCSQYSNVEIKGDVWFRYTPSGSGMATIASCGANFADVVAVYDECACPTGAPIACAYRPCPREDLLCLDVVEGACYLIQVGGLDEDEGGSTVLTVTLGRRCDTSPACPNPEHDCNTPGSVGCSDAACCEAVCALSTTCCDQSWDCGCVELARVVCGGARCADVTAPRGAITEPEPCGARTNDSCNAESATPISCGQIVAGTAWCDGVDQDIDHYSFTLNETSTVRFRVEAEFPGTIAIRPATCVNQFVAYEVLGGCAERTATACLEPGTYLAVLWHSTIVNPCGGAVGNDYVATLTCEPGCGTPPSNDACALPERVGDGLVKFSTEFASTDGPLISPECAPVILDRHLFNDVWFEYVATRDGTLHASIAASTIEARLLAYELAPCDDLPLHLVACTQATCNAETEFTLAIACGSRYLLRIGGSSFYSRGTGEFELTSSGRACGPIGDLNADGAVEQGDLAILLESWGTSGAADLDGDDLVDGQDLAILLGAWTGG